MAATKTEIPKHAIEFIVGKIHVGTSDAEVEATIRRRIAKDTPKRTVTAVVKYALAVHTRNRSLYNFVMKGGN